MTVHELILRLNAIPDKSKVIALEDREAYDLWEPEIEEVKNLVIISAGDWIGRQ